MKRNLRNIFIVLAVLLIAAQAIRPERTNPPVTGEINAPPEIKSILRKTCYNCHSNETVWPWYSQVAPASWLLVYDVGNARKRVNFSEWSSLPPQRQARKLKKAEEDIKEGEMPLWYYLPLHPEARLSDADKSALMAWLNEQASARGE
jgi:cytochrome c551/c552